GEAGAGGGTSTGTNPGKAGAPGTQGDSGDPGPPG
ncbi:hypothetical protein NDO10_19245, partial [Mycobacterium tuberculosis]